MLETPSPNDTVATAAISKASIPPRITISRTHAGKAFQGRPLVGRNVKPCAAARPFGGHIFSAGADDAPAEPKVARRR